MGALADSEFGNCGCAPNITISIAMSAKISVVWGICGNCGTRTVGMGDIRLGVQYARIFCFQASLLIPYMLTCDEFFFASDLFSIRFIL